MYKLVENLACKFFESLDFIEFWLKLKLGTVLGWIAAKIVKLYAYFFVGAGIKYFFAQLGVFILKLFAE